MGHPMVKRSITTSHAQNVETHGLPVNLLRADNLQSFHMIMSKPNSGILNTGHIREDAEVIL
jgi:hypothetical protein